MLDASETHVLELVAKVRASLKSATSREELRDVDTDAVMQLAKRSVDSDVASDEFKALKMYALGILRRAIVSYSAIGGEDGGSHDVKNHPAVDVHALVVAMQRLEGAVSVTVTDSDVLGPCTDVEGARALRMTKERGGYLEVTGIPGVKNSIKIAEGQCIGVGSGCKVWGAGLVMAAALSCAPDVVCKHRILEIGCGTGITGLTAAVINRCSTVVLSDGMEDVVQELRRSCTLSMEALEEAGSSVEVMLLNWNDQSISFDCRYSRDGIFYLVLGSDIIYKYDCVDNLASAIFSHAKCALLLQAVRHWKLIAAFIKEIQNHGGDIRISELPPFGISKVSDSLEGLNLTDFANSFPNGREKLAALVREDGQVVDNPNEIERYAGSMVFIKISHKCKMR